MSTFSPAFALDLQVKIERSGIVAVLVVDSAQDAVPLARALLAGGIGVMELTLRTPAALDALKIIRAEVPEMLAGVGTILTTAQVDATVKAGAAFGVAPGFNPKIVSAARSAGLPFAPGIMTPSYIVGPLELDCRLLKFFPAETTGGIKHLSAIAAPYAHLGVKYMPLGGINIKNVASYFESPLVAGIGGSLVPVRKIFQPHRWETLRKNSEE